VGESIVVHSTLRPKKLSLERYIVPTRRDYPNSQEDEDIFAAHLAKMTEPDVLRKVFEFWIKISVTRKFELAGAVEECSEAFVRMNFEDYLRYARLEPPFSRRTPGKIHFVIPDVYEMTMLERVFKAIGFI
jgi:hypothetical protein